MYAEINSKELAEEEVVVIRISITKAKPLQANKQPMIGKSQTLWEVAQVEALTVKRMARKSLTDSSKI